MNPTIIALLLAYVVFPLLFVLMEKFWFSLPDRKILRSGFGSDVIWYGFQSFVSQRLAPLVVYFVLGPVIFVYGMTTEEFFSGFGPVAQLPFWWQVPLVFVLADFLLYWQHRLFHTRRAWPFHAVHHSSNDLDWLSATRMHPVNEIGAQIFSAAPLLACGFQPLTLIVLGPFIGTYAVIIHANLRWTFGPLRYVIASPVFHRWHHTRTKDGGEKNFASYLPIWDLIFGTFFMPADRVPSNFGVDDPVPDGFLHQLVYPVLPTQQAAAHPDGATPNQPVA